MLKEIGTSASVIIHSVPTWLTILQKKKTCNICIRNKKATPGKH